MRLLFRYCLCVCACAHLGPYILAGGLGISSGRRSVPEAVVCGRTGTEPKCAQGERALEARTQRPGHFFSVLRPPDIRISMVSSNKSKKNRTTICLLLWTDIMLKGIAKLHQHFWWCAFRQCHWTWPEPLCFAHSPSVWGICGICF